MKPLKRLRFLLATQNEGKVREIEQALIGSDIQLVSVREQGKLTVPEETGLTFLENARLKALHYFRLTKIPTLAEDSGLVVDSLGGIPGVYSARFGRTDEERIEKLLVWLKPCHSRKDRRARFVSAFCLAQMDSVVEEVGEVKGWITKETRGVGGFGYDPVFYYRPMRKTFGEMTMEEKNQVSHRSRALEKLRKRLIELID